MSSPAQCAHCGAPLVIVLDLDDQPILDRLDRIEHLLGVSIRKEEKIMTDQENIDADVAAVEAVVTDEAAAVANIEAEIAALKSANPAVDLSGLDKAVADLKGAQAGVDALETPAPVDVPPADGTPVDDGTDAPAAE